MKIGLSVRIDVTKIDKSRLYTGVKGTYLDLTTFINTSDDDSYGNNGFISQSVDKDERASGIQTPILGNVKVFYTDSGANKQQPQQQQSQQQPQQHQQPQEFDDDIPF
jgi:hypothetical protein